MNAALSADATPFIPTTSNINNSANPNSSSLSADVPEFIPSGFSKGKNKENVKRNNVEPKNNKKLASRSKSLSATQKRNKKNLKDSGCPCKRYNGSDTVNGKSSMSTDVNVNQKFRRRELTAVKSVPILLDENSQCSTDKNGTDFVESDDEIMAVAQGRLASRKDTGWYKQKNLLAVQYSLPPTVFTEDSEQTELDSKEDTEKELVENKQTVQPTAVNLMRKDKKVVTESRSFSLEYRQSRNQAKSSIDEKQGMAKDIKELTRTKSIIKNVSSNTVSESVTPSKPLSWSSIVKQSPNTTQDDSKGAERANWRSPARKDTPNENVASSSAKRLTNDKIVAQKQSSAHQNLYKNSKPQTGVINTVEGEKKLHTQQSGGDRDWYSSSRPLNKKPSNSVRWVEKVSVQREPSTHRDWYEKSESLDIRANATTLSKKSSVKREASVHKDWYETSTILDGKPIDVPYKEKLQRESSSHKDWYERSKSLEDEPVHVVTWNDEIVDTAAPINDWYGASDQEVLTKKSVEHKPGSNKTSLNTTLSDEMTTIKFEKRKLTRTQKTFSNSSSSSDEASKRKAEIEKLKFGADAVKSIIQSHKSDVYKITKSKHRLLQKTEEQKEDQAITSMKSTDSSLVKVSKNTPLFSPWGKVDKTLITPVSKPTEQIQKWKKSNTTTNNVHYGSNQFPKLGESTVTTNRAPVSYSAALRKAVVKAPVSESNKTLLPQEKRKELTSEEIQLRKRNKALKRKMKIKMRKEEARLASVETPVKDIKPQQQNVKQSEIEIKLDISGMFDQLLTKPARATKSPQKQKQKKVTISTGVISVVTGLAKKNTPDGRKVQKNKYGGAPTILDGSTPIRKRGKERETPKRRPPTLLKKIIKAERERKRKLQEKLQQAKSKANEEQQEKIDDEAIVEVAAHDEKPADIDTTPTLAPAPTLIPTDVKESDEKVVVEPTKIQLNDLPEHIMKKLHSRKFREYCNHVLSKEINDLTFNLLTTLQRFQDRVYHENPTKYKQKRRYVLGLREVLKHCKKVKKIKAVIIAPNLERIAGEGGLDDYLSTIQNICKEKDIPQIFALNRHVLGRPLKKKAPVSIIGIFNYDGAQYVFGRRMRKSFAMEFITSQLLSKDVDVQIQDIYKDLIAHVQTAQETYNSQVKTLLEEEFGNIPDLSINADNDIESEQKDSIAQPVNSEAEQVRQNILGKFTADEFRIPAQS